uniref:TIGR00341 family protein n=1 Tax=Mariniflexile sp. TaxID=1979402 RepID=UPI004047CBA0
MDRTGVSLIRALKNFFKDRFDLHSDMERDTTTIAEITKGVEFRGTNLWILIFAIFIASIGLNVNSTAVVIGAMLISPLMGPIMGVGLGAGINDVSLINKSVRNLLIAAGMSILTSWLYFSITPLREAQSELLARTYPTLWDVLIALFGGLAGIVAGSRSSKSNAIPGVAIATALMPPLCTAGYGLANLNWYYFLGALFLFLINSVFISLSTFMIVRFLKYPRKTFDSVRVERRVKFYITFFVVITVVPSAYLAYNLVKQTIFQENARAFIAQEFRFADTQVIGSQTNYSQEGNTIDLTLYGKPLEATLLNKIESNMENYGLYKCQLIVHQGYDDDSEDQAKAFEEITQSMRFKIVEDLYKKNEELVASKDNKIKLLEDELLRLKAKDYPIDDISAELRVQYPTLTSLAISNAEIFDPAENKMDTTCFALLSFSKKPRSSDLKKIEEWIAVRTKNKQVEVIFRD